MAEKPKLPKRLSLSDVESTSERVMPGTYHAKVSGMELKMNKAGDAYYYNADLVIISEGPAKNRHVWDILSLKKDGLWKLKGFLVACGVDGDADIDLDEIPDLTIGQDVDVVIGEEDYQGEPRPVVRRIKPSTLPTLEDLAEDEDEDEDEDEAEEEEWDEESLGALSIKELRDVAREYEVYEKGMSRDEMVSAILGDEEDEEDEEDPFEDDDDEEEEEEPAPKKKGRVSRK